MKFTFDTNFLVSATQWDYSVAHKLLIKFIREGHELFTSNEILGEFKDILKRDFEYSDEEAGNIAAKILKCFIMVTPNKKVDVIKEDPDDDKIIECALESSSAYIISYDKHLLKLKEYSGIKITKPEEALNLCGIERNRLQPK